MKLDIYVVVENCGDLILLQGNFLSLQQAVSRMEEAMVDTATVAENRKQTQQVRVSGITYQADFPWNHRKVRNKHEVVCAEATVRVTIGTKKHRQQRIVDHFFSVRKILVSGSPLEILAAQAE